MSSPVITIGEFDYDGDTSGNPGFHKYIMYPEGGRKVTQYVSRVNFKDRKKPPSRIAVLVRVLEDEEVEEG